jgi:hypothetical protein
VNLNVFFSGGVVPSGSHWRLPTAPPPGCTASRAGAGLIFGRFVITGVVAFTAAITFGVTRYRAPVDALLPVLAAVGIIGFIDRRKRVTDESTDETPDLDQATAPNVPDLVAPFPQ